MPFIDERFHIRLAGSIDLDAAINLWQQLPGLTLRTEDAPATLQPLLQDGKLRLFVAECNAVIVGAVLLGDDGRRGYLYHLGVAEPVRALGLGRALVAAALEDLAARGISRSHVFVNTDNEAAQGFWAHLGWRQRIELAVYSSVLEVNDAD